MADLQTHQLPFSSPIDLQSLIYVQRSIGSNNFADEKITPQMILNQVAGDEVSTVGANPDTPAIGATEIYTVTNTAALLTQQYYGFDGIAGSFLVTAIASATSVTLQNVDAAVGSTVPAGTRIGSVGKPGSGSSGSGGGLTRQVITESQTALDGVALVCNSATLLDITIPSSGTRIAVASRNTGGFTVRPDYGVNIKFGDTNIDNVHTYIASTNQFSYVELFGLGNNQWIAVASINVNYGTD